MQEELKCSLTMNGDNFVFRKILQCYLFCVVNLDMVQLVQFL